MIIKKLSLLAVAACSFSLQAREKPNIILMLADDLGYGDLSCFNANSDIHTPNIDRMAERGVKFTNFYASAPVCSPSRRSLLTGQYPSRIGEWAEAYRDIPTEDGIQAKKDPTIGIFLKKAGYETACYGKWNIGARLGISDANAHGFDHAVTIDHNATYFSHYRDMGVKELRENGKLVNRDGEFLDDIFINEGIKFIKKNKDKPFFLYLPFATPHEPIQAPDDPDSENTDRTKWWKDPNATPNDRRFSSANWGMRPDYIKMVEHLDAKIGQLISILDELGIKDNTILIFTSDNGGHNAALNFPLNGFKQQLSEGGIRVPMIAEWDGKIASNKMVDQESILMDITRTLIQLGEAEKYIPQKRILDGIDLMPFMTENKDRVERELAWRRRNWSPGKQGFNKIWTEGYRKGDWKYVREFQEAPPWARFIKDKATDNGYVEALYNLGDDLGEAKNLAPEKLEKLAEMRSAFETWKSRVVNKAPIYKIPFADQYGSPE